MQFLKRKKTIYYPGHTLIKYCPHIVQNWKSILTDFGISFIIFEDMHSGWSLWNQGFQEEFENHIKNLQHTININSIKTIITSSPEAYFIFNNFLKRVTVRHTTQIAYENSQKIQQYDNGELAWHDNTTQVRRNNIIKEPRHVAELAGFTIKEFTENKKDTQCLGTSTGLVNNSPRLADKLALRRIRLSPCETILTDSPEDYIHLKRNNANVLELSEVLVEI